MRRMVKNERGIALFLVLWVMALLTVIAGEFGYAVRTELNVTRNFKEETETYYIAVSGLFLTIQELVVNEFIPRPSAVAGSEAVPEDVRWRINADLPPVPFGGGQFKVEKENESGKVNLNRAGEPLLRMMLNNFSLEESEKNIIVDSILDWRDKDNLHRLNGAEDDYYLSLPRPYKCKNGDFTSLEELLLVRGVTPKMFDAGLKDMISVYQEGETGSTGAGRKAAALDVDRINVNAASLSMLRSLPRMTEEAVQAIRNYREQRDFRSLTDLSSVVGAEVFTGISPYVTLSLVPYYTIRSVGMLKESGIRQGVQAVVKIDKNLEKGYEIIQWIDGLEYRS
ncbi:MAG: type II secretion system minor pseudopilin [Syntrophales bacterium]